MSEPTLEGLWAYIKEQNPERKIDQLSWNTCAGGEYCASIGYGNVTNLALKYMNCDLGERILLSLCDTYGEAQEALKIAGL